MPVDSRKYTPVFPTFKRFVKAGLGAKDIYDLFMKHGFDANYATVYGWTRKASTDEQVEIGFGIPKWAEDAARTIWGKERDTNIALRGYLAVVSPVATAHPETPEAPPQLAEEVGKWQSVNEAAQTIVEAAKTAQGEAAPTPSATPSTDPLAPALTEYDVMGGHFSISAPKGTALDLDKIMPLLRVAVGTRVTSIEVRF
jgi:hypothetical protein